MVSTLVSSRRVYVILVKASRCDMYFRRSPAEGAYSEGFISSKFTQDFCIECPATSSLFSLKTGEIVSWYDESCRASALAFYCVGCQR